MNSTRFRPTRAVVNLKRIADNFRVLKNSVAVGAFVCPMVKANAYGHGDVAVAARLRLEGAEYLGVGLIEEGLKLRDGGDVGRVLHFGMFDDQGAEAMLEHRITPVISSQDTLESLVRSIERHKNAPSKPVELHLKINTGMNRLGVPISEVAAIAKRLAAIANHGYVELKGVCTHFAIGEDFDDSSGQSFEQMKLFRHAETLIRSSGLIGFQSHVANSSATAAIGHLARINSSYKHLGIRPGISLYGVEPAPRHEALLGLKPALKLESRIILIQNIKKGEGVSYGLRWRAEKDSRIGVIPCGYADGYRRGFSNGTFVLVNGRRVPVVGTVCMDYFMCDLTEVESALVGDAVTLIGAAGGVSVTVNELALRVHTIAYEILTGISDRVPRVYVDDEPADS
jgi:alanine racemase